MYLELLLGNSILNPIESHIDGFAKTHQIAGLQTLSQGMALYIGRKMEKDAKDHISIYLEVVSPLLEDIAGLFEEMNCDDLTKV